MTLREEVKSKVEQCLWINKWREDEERVQNRLKLSRSPSVCENKIHFAFQLTVFKFIYLFISSQSQFDSERCTVCTLPLGLCEHTREWIEENYYEKQRKRVRLLSFQ